MGWWRPYFFLDPTGVQLLSPSLALSDAPSLLLGAAGLLLLAMGERHVAHALARSSTRHTPADDTAFALLWTANRLVGTLVMLLFMSFNVPIILWLLTCLGVAERLELWRERRRANGGGWSAAPPI